MNVFQPSYADAAQAFDQFESFDRTPEERPGLEALEQRLGHLYVSQRLGIEREYETHILKGRQHFFHSESWCSFYGFIQAALRLSGLHARGRRNARSIEV